MKQGNFGDREWVGVAAGRGRGGGLIHVIVVAFLGHHAAAGGGGGGGGLFHVIGVAFLGHQVLSVVHVAMRYTEMARWRWHGTRQT